MIRHVGTAILLREHTKDLVPYTLGIKLDSVNYPQEVALTWSKPWRTRLLRRALDVYGIWEYDPWFQQDGDMKPNSPTLFANHLILPILPQTSQMSSIGPQSATS